MKHEIWTETGMVQPRVDFPTFIEENEWAPLHEKPNSNMSTDFQKSIFLVICEWSTICQTC